KDSRQNNKRRRPSSNLPSAFDLQRIRTRLSALARNSDTWFSVSNAQNRIVVQLSLRVAAAPDRENARQKHYPRGSQPTSTLDRNRSRGSRRRMVQGFWIIQTMRRRAISENFPAARSASSRNKAIAGLTNLLFVSERR